jgi:hypothetical protein
MVGPKNINDLRDSLQCVATRLSAADILYLEHGEIAERIGVSGDCRSTSQT